MVHPIVRRSLSEKLATVDHQSEMNATCQRHHIHAMEARDKNAASSRALLETFQTTLALHYHHRDCPLSEMAE
jgi:hypothetical protein